MYKNIQHYSYKINIDFRFKLDAAGTFKSQEFFHYFHNNITYKRAYLPDQYWDGKGVLDFFNKTILIEVNIFSRLIYF